MFADTDTAALLTSVIPGDFQITADMKILFTRICCGKDATAALGSKVAGNFATGYGCIFDDSKTAAVTACRSIVGTLPLAITTLAKYCQKKFPLNRYSR